ncbi:MAG: RES family NAD+ phosphorylase [Chitinophaga sp.]
MTVYRIVLKRYAKNLFAPGIAGRWNSEGNKVIYAAGSISLAVMENLVRRNGYGFNRDFAIMHIDIPDDLSKTVLHAEALPMGWNDPGNYAVSQGVGDQWYDSGKTAVLQAPSVVVPEEYNFVLHSLHVDFTRCRITGVKEFVPDVRVDAILKK